MPGKPYSPDEMGIVIRNALAGETYAAIAAKLDGRTIASVSKQCYRVGIYKTEFHLIEARKPKPHDIVDRMGDPVCRPHKVDDQAFQAAMGRAVTTLCKIGETP